MWIKVIVIVIKSFNLLVVLRVAGFFGMYFSNLFYFFMCINESYFFCVYFLNFGI